MTKSEGYEKYKKELWKLYDKAIEDNEKELALQILDRIRIEVV